jgi:rfaE bifunctional protein kinase chain/domain
VRLRRLDEILHRIADTCLVVAGDFFLDQYWMVDPSLEEISLETDLAAYQVAEIRLNPGAAGTVSNNLATFGVGRVEAVGIVGDDGSGVELLKGLQKRGIRTDNLIVTPLRFTPVYTKPLSLDSGEEMHRFDIKNRSELPHELEEAFLRRLESSLTQAHGVAILDQVQEEDCGVITGRVREELGNLALKDRRKVFLADSRTRILDFQHVIIKPNQNEASEALSIPRSDKEGLLRRLASISQGPVFMTCGSDGISLFDGERHLHFSAIPVSGPIDIVGAGDSVSAAILSSLCAGADLGEAAQLANLVASITIRKLGTTGTASPQEILETAERHRETVESW